MSFGVRDAGRQKREAEVIATVDGQVGNGTLFDHVRLLDALAFDNWRFRLDQVDRRCESQLKLQIEADGGSDREQNSLTLRLPEAGRFDGKFVDSGGKQIESIETRLISFSPPRELSRGIGHRDLRVLDYGVAGIGDGSRQRRGTCGLGKSREAQQQQQERGFHGIRVNSRPSALTH